MRSRDAIHAEWEMKMARVARSRFGWHQRQNRLRFEGVDKGFAISAMGNVAVLTCESQPRVSVHSLLAQKCLHSSVFSSPERLLRTPAHDGRDSEMMADSIPAA
jgi:hypothetical protein